jgi:hypothetical protein
MSIATDVFWCTFFGTIRTNRRELLKLAEQTKHNMTRFSTKLYCSNNCTLTICKSKPNKITLIFGRNTKKNNVHVPETIRLCNSIKFSVGMTGQMARKYTVKLKSWRWLLQVFFNILDLTEINTWIRKGDLAEPIANTNTGSREQKICKMRYVKNSETNNII